MADQTRAWIVLASLLTVTLLLSSTGSSEEDSGPGYFCGETQPLDGLTMAQVNAAVPEVWFDDEDTHQGTVRYLIASKPAPVHVVIFNYRWESWGSYKCLGTFCEGQTSPGGAGALVCEGSATLPRYMGIAYEPNMAGHSDVLISRL